MLSTLHANHDNKGGLWYLYTYIGGHWLLEATLQMAHAIHPLYETCLRRPKPVFCVVVISSGKQFVDSGLIAWEPNMFT